MQSAPISEDRVFDRIRWRARRGLLENDLLLRKFMETTLTKLSAAELETLDELLRLGDNDLLDLLMGRKTSANPRLGAMVERIQNA
jgi:antitoxin CptB